MSLPAGKVYTAGTIVGRHGRPGLEITGPSGGLTSQLLLGPVIQTLCTRHAFSRRVDYSSYREHGFSLGQESPAMQGGADGTVLRVFYGCGKLKVNGVEPRQWFGLGYGDWIYVPPCASVTLTGAAISGRNQFGLAELRPVHSRK